MLLKKTVPGIFSILLLLLLLVVSTRQPGDSLLFETITRFGNSVEGMNVRQVKDLLAPLAKRGSIQEWRYGNGETWIVWEWSNAAGNYLTPVRYEQPENYNSIVFEGETLTTIELSLSLPVEDIVQVFGFPTGLYPNSAEEVWFTSTYLIYRTHYMEFIADSECCQKTLVQRPLITRYSNYFVPNSQKPYYDSTPDHSWDDYKAHWDWPGNVQFGAATPTPTP